MHAPRMLKLIFILFRKKWLMELLLHNMFRLQTNLPIYLLRPSVLLYFLLYCPSSVCLPTPRLRGAVRACMVFHACLCYFHEHSSCKQFQLHSVSTITAVANRSSARCYSSVPVHVASSSSARCKTALPSSYKQHYKFDKYCIM